MSKKAPDPDKTLRKAMRKYTHADPDLRGSEPQRFVLLLESEWPDGGSTFSVVKSPGQLPWESLGMLEFAQIQERELASGLDDGDDGDEDEDDDEHDEDDDRAAEAEADDDHTS